MGKAVIKAIQSPSAMDEAIGYSHSAYFGNRQSFVKATQPLSAIGESAAKLLQQRATVNAHDA